MNAASLGVRTVGTFARALALLEDGRVITRSGWPPGRRIRIVRDWRAYFPSIAEVPPDLAFPSIVVEDRDGSGHLGWVPERGDLAATDWQVLP